MPPCTYTITVTNTGQTPYTGASVTDSLAGVLDDAAYNGDGAATTGSVAFASPALTWTGDLAPGATATITYTVKVDNPDTGNGILASTVTSAAAGNNCPDGSTDPRCATTVDVAALTITNTASVSTATPGSRSPTRSRCTTPGRSPTAAPASPTRWAPSWMTPPTTTTPSRPAARSPSPAPT